MRRALAALMIQQMPHVIDLPAVPRRRAQHAMRLREIGDEETAASAAATNVRLLEQIFPVHVSSFSASVQPSRSQSTRDVRARTSRAEPLRSDCRLRRGDRRSATPNTSAQTAGILERAVQVRADHAGRTHDAVDAAVVEPRERLDRRRSTVVTPRWIS